MADEKKITFMGGDTVLKEIILDEMDRIFTNFTMSRHGVNIETTKMTDAEAKELISAATELRFSWTETTMKIKTGTLQFTQNIMNLSWMIVFELA